MGTKIEWTDETWTVVYGCTRKSPGCDNCYAVRQMIRLAGTLECARGLVSPARDEVRRHFNGKIRLLPDRLDRPLHWKKPCKVFVNSMSDLFHPEVPFEFVDKVFAVMALCPQHTFQVLTKRPERMRNYMNNPLRRARVDEAAFEAWRHANPPRVRIWPLRNVWMGVSCENQATADERIPHLLQTPAAIRWVSFEPALGPVDVRQALTYLRDDLHPEDSGGRYLASLQGIDWIVCGGESGPSARPMHPDWVRSIRDQCRAAGVPFLFKQWGAWVTASVSAFGNSPPIQGPGVGWMWPDGRFTAADPEDDGVVCTVKRVGKKAAGRELDGKVWDEYPTN